MLIESKIKIGYDSIFNNVRTIIFAAVRALIVTKYQGIIKYAQFPVFFAQFSTACLLIRYWQVVNLNDVGVTRGL